MTANTERLDKLAAECEVLALRLTHLSRRSTAVNLARCQTHMALVAQYAKRCYNTAQTLRTLDLLQSEKSVRRQRILKKDLERFGGADCAADEAVGILMQAATIVLKKGGDFYRDFEKSIRPYPEKTDFRGRLDDLELEHDATEQERLLWDLLCDYEQMESTHADSQPVGSRGESLVRLRGCRDLIEDMLLFKDQRSPTKFLQFATLPKKELDFGELYTRCIEFFADTIEQESSRRD